MRATLKPVSLAAVMGLFIISLPLLNTGLSVTIELTLQIVLGALIYVSLLRVLNRGAIAEVQSALFSR
jgi:hypothetical protein